MTISAIDLRRPSHLSAEAIGLLRALLLCQLAEHADHAAEWRATADELTADPDGDDVERELAEAAGAHFDTTAEQARTALRRLDNGTYGLCEACAQPIPYERLEAIPHTRRCVRCPEGSQGLLV